MTEISDISSPLNAAPEPSLGERRALIERVATSEYFSRSVRLREFLLYVGRQSLKEGCPEVREQEIGIHVFGRAAAYDRSQDNIVRVNATELRKRVEAYFSGAGSEEPLIFDIPRGSYKPHFHWRQHAIEPSDSGAAAPVHPIAPVIGVQRGGFRAGWDRIALSVLSITLAIVCGVLWQENRKFKTSLQLSRADQPIVSAFWSGFFDPHRDTALVLPDDSASVIVDITGTPIQLGEYLGSGFMRRIQSSRELSEDRKRDLNQIFNHNLVTFGAVRAAQAVLNQIPPGYSRYLAVARNFTADQLTRSNAVLIGGSKSIPWDHLFDHQLNFDTTFDYQRGVAVVRNRNPKPGEQALYSVSTAPDDLTGYAVIAYLPNPSHTGQTILLAGTDSDATGSAAAFLTSEEKMAKLRASLHVDQFPYFEVLLKTSRVSGTFFGADPIAFRTYQPVH